METNRNYKFGTVVNAIGLIAILLKTITILTVPWAIVLIPHFFLTMEWLSKKVAGTVKERNYIEDKLWRKQRVKQVLHIFYSYLALIAFNFFEMADINWHLLLIPIYLITLIVVSLKINKFLNK